MLWHTTLPVPRRSMPRSPGIPACGQVGAAGDLVVADCLASLVAFPVATIQDPVVDVLDRVADDEDVLRVLGVDAPAAVLDGEALEDDVARVVVVVADSDDAALGVGAVDHARRSVEGNRLACGAGRDHLKRRIGARRSDNGVAGLGSSRRRFEGPG